MSAGTIYVRKTKARKRVFGGGAEDPTFAPVVAQGNGSYFSLGDRTKDEGDAVRRAKQALAKLREGVDELGDLRH